MKKQRKLYQVKKHKKLFDKDSEFTVVFKLTWYALPHSLNEQWRDKEFELRQLDGS